MKNNFIYYMTILLCSSILSCSINSSTSHPSSEKSLVTLHRVPSLDFSRGDAIPYSIALCPRKNQKGQFDLTVDHFCTLVNSAYLETKEKEIKPGSDPDAVTRWANYINDFTDQLITSDLIQEKHMQRARTILIILQATVRTENDNENKYVHLKDLPDTHRASMIRRLKPIVLNPVNTIIQRDIIENSENFKDIIGSLVHNLTSEYHKLPLQQKAEILEQYHSSEIHYLPMCVALDEYNKNKSETNRMKIYKVSANLSNKEVKEAIKNHSMLATRK